MKYLRRPGRNLIGRVNRCGTVLLGVILYGILGSTVYGQGFRFTVSADNRPSQLDNINRWQWLLSEMAQLVGDEGVFHIIPGDFDDPQVTDATLKARFGENTIWYPVVGNHETYTQGYMTWIRNAFSGLPFIVKSGPPGSQSTTYSFDYGNAHFIAINEYYDGSTDIKNDADVVDALYDWLVADLAANTRPVIFVTGHEPAYPQNRHIGESLDEHPNNRDRFWKLLNDNKVIAYFCAHTHIYNALQQAQTGTYPSDAFTWQIDCGNAGNRYYPDEQTFVDVAVTDTEVVFRVFQGIENVPFEMISSWTVDIPALNGKAGSPSPPDGATAIAADSILDWSAGAGAVSHNVYFGAGAPDFKQNQAGTSYDPGTLDYGITYYWRIDEVSSDGTVTAGNVWSFTTQSDHYDDMADRDIPVSGTVGNTYVGTNYSDNVYQTITETEAGGKPANRYSYLEHKWTINVTGGNSITFNIEARRTAGSDGDDFVFAYSTDGSSYTNMLTIAGEADYNQSFILPSSISGTVYIRVTDTDRTAGNRTRDTIFIDHMYIRSSLTGTSDTNPPPAPTNLTATAGDSQILLSWNPVLEPDLAGYNVYRASVSGGPYSRVNSSLITAKEYLDTGLLNYTTYYYVATAADSAGNLSGYSNEASAAPFAEVTDIVTITTAQYKRRQLELYVESKSILNGMAMLEVFDLTGSVNYGKMSYDSRTDKYTLKVRPVDDPALNDPGLSRITVISSRDGRLLDMQTKSVTYK